MESSFAILVSVVAALATAFFTSRFYVYQAKADLEKELKKEFESRFNERKWEAYTGFADTVRQVLESSKSGHLNRDMPKLTRQLFEFTSRLWLVGSDEVVEAVVGWQRYIRKGERAKENPIENLVKLVTILIEMRRDLGYKSTQISPKDMLATFITDIESHIPD